MARPFYIVKKFYNRERCSVMRSSILTVLCLRCKTFSVEATNPKIIRSVPASKSSSNIGILHLVVNKPLFQYERRRILPQNYWFGINTYAILHFSFVGTVLT